jgi:hypothetical protein
LQLPELLSLSVLLLLCDELPLLRLLLHVLSFLHLLFQIYMWLQDQDLLVLQQEPAAVLELRFLF